LRPRFVTEAVGPRAVHEAALAGIAPVQRDKHREVFTAVEGIVVAECCQEVAACPPSVQGCPAAVRRTVREPRWDAAADEARRDATSPYFLQSFVNPWATAQGKRGDGPDDGVADDALDAFQTKTRVLASNGPLPPREDDSQSVEMEQDRFDDRKTTTSDVRNGDVVEVCKHEATMTEDADE